MVRYEGRERALLFFVQDFREAVKARDAEPLAFQGGGYACYVIDSTG
jgi:hypothetical protein